MEPQLQWRSAEAEAPRHSHLDKLRAQGRRKRQRRHSGSPLPPRNFPTEPEGTSCWRTAQSALCLVLATGDVFASFRTAGSPQATHLPFRHTAALVLGRGQTSPPLEPQRAQEETQSGMACALEAANNGRSAWPTLHCLGPWEERYVGLLAPGKWEQGSEV